MNYRLISLILAAGLSISMAAAPKKKLPVVSEASLLKEMLDRDALAKLPSPSYTTLQFSSYDRNSVAPDKPGWYANGDCTQFLRSEKVGDRTEHVMLETEGPGAIIRFWMTLAGGENGMVRIYIDDSDTPAVQGNVMDLLSGEIITGEPLAASVSKLTPREQRGHDLYYPIPYAKSCKVTYEKNTNGNGSVYYNIECRKYTEEVSMVSFKGTTDPVNAKAAAETNAALMTKPVLGKKSEKTAISAVLQPCEEVSYEVSGAKAIEYLAMKLKAADYSQALRSTVISISFDSENTVWVPVGDFFGTGYSSLHNNTFFNTAEPQGKLESFWVMPFEKTCVVKLHNYGEQMVSIEGELSCKKWKWDERSLHFGAVWYELYDAKTGLNNHSMPQDINFVTLEGQGKYMGDVTTIFNTTGSWWGEGDEKVYVDGESFPSHFGTGTEDYYGYAWCAPPVFTDHPFIALPIGDGNLGIGRTVNNRFRSLDAITFDKSLVFDMELFEWDHNRIIYAPTSFWYLRPGGKWSVQPDPEAASRKVVMTREQLCKPVITAFIEGEDMTVESCGGNQHIQFFGGAGKWMHRTCLFMKDAPVGACLTASFESPFEAEVTADAIFGMAKDYATVNVYFNGEKVVSEENLWHFEVDARTVPMGKVKLLKGKNLVKIEIAKPGDSRELGVVGLDRIIFYY